MAAASSGARAGQQQAQGGTKEVKPFYERMTSTVFTFVTEDEADKKLPKIVSNIIAQCKAQNSVYFEVSGRPTPTSLYHEALPAD